MSNNKRFYDHPILPELLYSIVYLYSNNIKIESKIFKVFVKYFENSDIFGFKFCKENFRKDITVTYKSLNITGSAYKVYNHLCIINIFIMCSNFLDYPELKELIDIYLTEDILHKISLNYPYAYTMYIESDFNTFNYKELFLSEDICLNMQILIIDFCEHPNLEFVLFDYLNF
uniref:Uncharacterized protein n=1 Tax=Pithovirus LCDPAC02 TaxID=2506601 RepID=A0A481YNY3_9VIRU|nr:MAG: hypothetical protein LCDPAC02_02320 [Pithovirus LCDPAC02]